LERLAKEHQNETAKADTEAEMIESLRQKNKKLTTSLKNVTLENKNISNEHALVASELITKKMELARVHDENDALKQQVTELRKVLDVIPAQIESQVQSDMDKLCHKNQELTQRNAHLQDQLADMEALVIEMKMKYAHSESERELLKQKLSDLKRWMNNV
jgi:chromosome segregation ATPase